MLLYIIRHAPAGSPDDPAWPDDRQRPLSEEGRQRFAKLVRWLAARDFAPELIVTSPLVRCRQTAELVAAGIAGRPEVVPRDELAPGSDLKGLLKWTARHKRRPDQVAWVGHAPDVGRLTAALIGQGGAAIDFSKGAVAALRFDDGPAAGQGELRWLVTPKLVER